MIADVLRTPQFKYFFSALVGVALVIVIFRPYCKGDNCNIWKAPPPTEVREAVFQIGKKCYTFKEKDDECKADEKYIEGFLPPEGASTTQQAMFVEGFRGEFACRQEPVAPLKAKASGPYGPTYLPPEGLLKDEIIPRNFEWSDASCGTS